jgi:hypothetical protein
MGSPAYEINKKAQILLVTSSVDPLLNTFLVLLSVAFVIMQIVHMRTQFGKVFAAMAAAAYAKRPTL